MRHGAGAWLIVTVLGLVLAWPADGDAQRRRRRRRDRDRETPAAPAAGPELPDNPFGEMRGGERPAAPPAQPGTPAGAQPATPPPPPAQPATPPAQPSPPAGRRGQAPQQPAETPPPSPPAEEEEPAGPDLGPLREELQGILDDLVQARARAAAVGQALFHTRLRIVVQRRGDDMFLARLVVKLDNGVVFRSEPSFRGDAGVRIFEGFATPGPHQVEFEIEQRARGGETYRYHLRDSYRFEVLADRLTELTLVIDDDSEIADDFPDDESGEYDVRTRLRVDTFGLPAR